MRLLRWLALALVVVFALLFAVGRPVTWAEAALVMGDVAAGVVDVDIAGLGRLFGDPEAIAQRLVREARGVGLIAHVGIAATRTAANFRRQLCQAQSERTSVMTIKVGDRLPDTTFMTMGPDGAPKPTKTAEVFAGKRVALFAVPGAYTPTCHKQHMAGFVQN